MATPPWFRDVAAGPTAERWQPGGRRPPSLARLEGEGGLRATLIAAADTGFRTAIGLLVLPATLVVASLCAMLLVLVRAPAAWVDRVYVGFARFALWVAGTRVEMNGLEHVQPGQAYVVVSNHESNWDPVVLVGAMRPLRLRAVVKEQAARIPIFGRALLLTGNVRVERTNAAADVGRIEDAMTRRRSDVSMLFYAEGTRSRDGAFHPFKKGAFATAIAHRLPILPVGTAGTRRLWPPLTLRLLSGPVVLEIGPPILVAGLTLDDRERLRDQAHRAVGELRAAARSRLRALGIEPGGVD
jgi:1-acyl-sn-glycerol-3-phosphate acyltransferase